MARNPHICSICGEKHRFLVLTCRLGLSIVHASPLSPRRVHAFVAVAGQVSAVADAPAGGSVSIWSVKAEDARTFFRIVGVLWLVALARIGYNMSSQWTVAAEQWWSAGDFALAVLGDFSDVGMGAAMAAMLLTRPVNVMGEVTMSVYHAIVNRYVIPVIERHKAEGRAEGQAAEREKWWAWNQRRIEAEKRGLQFDESPPGAARPRNR